MENGRNVNAIGTQEGITVMPLELNEQYMSSDDIMNRRLKNRERQRRYRLRKKIEADSKKDLVPSQPTRPQEDVESIGNQYNYINHVYCKRNWKKDARRAHACKKLQEAPVMATISGSALKSDSQKQASLVPKITIEVQHSTRDWKAEARRKKN